MNMRNSGWSDETPERPGGAGRGPRPGMEPQTGDAPRDRVADGNKGFHPARLALGVALNAADRIRAGPPSDTFLVGVGLAQQTAAEVRGLARRALRPPSWAASRTADPGVKRSGVSPNAGQAGWKPLDRKSTRLNSSHLGISYAVFCLKKKKKKKD